MYYIIIILSLFKYIYILVYPVSPIFRQTQVSVDSGRQSPTPETPAKIRLYLSAKLI